MKTGQDFDVKDEEVVEDTDQAEDSSADVNNESDDSEDQEIDQEEESQEVDQDDEEEEDSETDEDEEDDDSESDSRASKNVPYSRFKEANEGQKYFKEQAERERLEKEALKKQLEETTASKAQASKTPEEIKAEEEEKAFIEKIAPVLKKAGFVSKEEIEHEKQEEARKREIEESVRQIREQESQLSQKFQKIKGMPPVDANDLVRWGHENGIITNNVEALYKLRYERQYHSYATVSKAKALPVTKPKAQGANDQIMTLEEAWEKLSASEFRDWAKTQNKKAS